jgi:hypothetical protein
MASIRWADAEILTDVGQTQCWLLGEQQEDLQGVIDRFNRVLRRCSVLRRSGRAGPPGKLVHI